MNRDAQSKLDVFNFIYTDEDNTYGYTIGKSIVDNTEKYVTDVKLNPLSEDYLQSFRYMLQLDCSMDVRTISIDYRLLSKETIDLLKEAVQAGYLAGIRITPENATLTKDIADLFNDEVFRNFLIAVDRVSGNIDMNSMPVDIREQEGICKIEHVMYRKDNKDYDNYNIHISEKLKPDQIRFLAMKTRTHSYQNIIVDFYDPGYYRELLEILRECNIPRDIKIRLLANPLYDQADCYENLDLIIPNQLEINYNTCNDLNVRYRTEPYTEGARYYSDIEASGITDVANYQEMIKTIDEVVTHMEEKNYSPLEKIAYLHDYFKKNFIYDPNYQFVSHAENAHLDKVYRKDRMICEGFSNLYSAILRRAGVLCFTYGTDNHQKNMVRVVDEKYGVDNLALIDATFDLDVPNNRNYFQNFLVPIDNDLYSKEPEVISIPTSLTMASADYYAYIGNSNPVYATNPLGYGIRMLQLMGLNHGNLEFYTEVEESEFYKSALANSYLTDKIPHEKIAEAIQNVRDVEDNYLNDTERKADFEEMSSSVQTRGNSYYIAPAIKLWGPPETIVDVDLFNTRINTYDINFENVPNQTQIYNKPRKRIENESQDMYRKYLIDFYHDNFYMKEQQEMIKIENEDRGAESMNEEENIEEYEIDEIPVSKITMYRDVSDSGRIFASRTVFERFNIDLPIYEVALSNGEVVYELPTDAAIDILNKANNNYSPYYVNFMYLELNEKDIQQIEEIEKHEEFAPQEKHDEYVPQSLVVIPEDPSKEIAQYIDNMPDDNKEELNKMMNDDNLIANTEYKKPRDRRPDETDDEYVMYLEEYYDSIFGKEEEDKPIFDLLNDNLIPGTNYERPRVRGIYETDEEYVTYLEDYYNSIFGVDDEKNTQHKR